MRARLQPCGQPATTRPPSSPTTGEVRGWAAAEAYRSGRVGCVLALTAWSVYGFFGHSYGVAFATDRHATRRRDTGRRRDTVRLRGTGLEWRLSAGCAGRGSRRRVVVRLDPEWRHQRRRHAIPTGDQRHLHQAA